jgi:hypothetical protein
MTKFFTATVPATGQVFTRSSASRSYSHMTAVRRSYSHALAQALGQWNQDQDLQNGAYYLTLLAGKAFDPARGAKRGTVISVREYLEYFRRPYAGTANYSRPVTDEEVAEEVARNIASATDRLEGATTPEAFAAAQMTKRLEKLEAQKADGHFERFQDGGWASRLDLAQKVAGTAQAKPYYEEVMVLEAIEVDGPTYRAAVKAAKVAK